MLQLSNKPYYCSKILWFTFQLSNKPYKKAYPFVPCLKKLGIHYQRSRLSIPSSREHGFLGQLDIIPNGYMIMYTNPHTQILGICDEG